MFNEAFWFFYWVGLVNAAGIIFGVFAMLTLIAAMFTGGCWFIDGHEGAKKPFRILSILGVIFLFVAIAIPSQTAMYAGAGQYVAEATEIDATLLKLKEALDAKLEELANE